MKIIFDDNIPFISDHLDKIIRSAGIDEYTIVYAPQDEIDAVLVRDADALFVRTHTRCDSSLLAGSRVRFLATASIGMDHIDRDWCSLNGIKVVNAPGCNAPAVVQWVFAALSHLLDAHDPKSLTMGIVGVGNVGSLVAQGARQRGYRVLLNDPRRAATEQGEEFVSLDTIAEQADIITLHPDLNPTSVHLVNSDFLGKLRRHPVLLNASRGPVVDTEALINALDAGLVADAAIDVWEGEPHHISPEIIRRCRIATPHIAGYSIEGKKRATAMVLNDFARYLGSDYRMRKPRLSLDLSPDAMAEFEQDILACDMMFRDNFTDLDRVRANYTLRHEPGRGRR